MICAIPRAAMLLIAFLLVLSASCRNGFCDEGDLTGDGWKTQAERSNYSATSTYTYVMDLCGRLAEHSPRIHLTEFGKSHEGRSLPLLIISDPPIDNASEVRDSKKLVVFAMANIHAGEVCGKEALQMIARDAAGTTRPNYLDQVILLLAPIYNADGNERMAKDNRPGQNGPTEGMGVRENAQGLDLNRDHVKLDSLEARALIELFNTYDPDIVVDCHATNGSAHRYVLTYDGARHPATPGDIIRYTLDDFLPAISQRMEKRTGYRSFYYGNFSLDRKQWETYPAWPRYNTPYVGLRGKIGILSEAYSYASFKDRVLATKAFVEEVTGLAAEQADEIKRILQHAKDDALHMPSEVAIQTDLAAFEKTYRVLGYEPTDLPPADEATGRTRDYELKLLSKSVPKVSVSLPEAYVFPASLTSVAEILLRHGIEVNVLREDVTLPCEVFHLTEFSQAKTSYQGHNNVTLAGNYRKESRSLQAGSFVIRCNQPLNRLITNLLEPQAEDGLATWNFYDPYLEVNQDMAIVRVTSPHPWLTTRFSPPWKKPQSKRPLTYADLYGSNAISLNGNPASTFRWLPDNAHYLTVRNGDWYRVLAATGETEKHFDKQKVAELLANASGASVDHIRPLINAFLVSWNPNYSIGVVEINGDLYAFWCDEDRVCRLTQTPGTEELATFSPDGQRVAYVRDFDLYSCELKPGTEIPLSSGGHSLLRHGKADWVYFEEIYNRDWQGYVWSPDSKWIAYAEYDDNPVKDFFVLSHMQPRGYLERERYPKSGDPIPHVRLGIVSALGGATRWNELADYSIDNRILTRFGWTPGSSRLYLFIQDRAQKWLDIRHLDRESGIMSPPTRWQSKYWVADPEAPLYLQDGSYVICNELSGWKHIHHHRPDGTLIRQLTHGAWEVRKLLGLTPDQSSLVFMATKDKPTEEHAYRVRIDGSELTRITDGGDHSVAFAPDLSRFIDTHSQVDQPPQVALRDSDGKLLRRLDSNPVTALDEIALRPVERFTIRLPNGFDMPCSLIRPSGCEPGCQKRFPVWITTYGGPHAPTVDDSWQQGRGFSQLLASMGIVAFSCDPQAASGQGAQSTWVAYQQLGVQETKDLEAAADWLRQQSYVAAEKIGLSGHSYGGYLTSYAMTHSDRFSAGIAGAPVTDWRNYDAFYTERYMNTPQENPEGYVRSSVVRAGANLKGKLLLIHGAMDDNVHLQNTLQLAQSLQIANKDFEIMIYPTSRHGIHGEHYQRLMIEFIRKTMLGEE